MRIEAERATEQGDTARMAKYYKQCYDFEEDRRIKAEVQALQKVRDAFSGYFHNHETLDINSSYPV